MQQRIREFFQSKLDDHSVLILGFGKEGQSTYSFLRQLFPEAPLALADQSLAMLENKEVESDVNADYYLGDDYLDSLQQCDFIIKSPGISLKDVELPKDIEISSQTDLFVELFREQIIGVTGTKGKSTTVSLLTHILENLGKEVFLLGNIGKPAFESITEVKKDSWLVLEMSSHQLEYCSNSPKYAVLLNLFQEHLDHYKSYLHYQEAKLNIAKWQGAGDVLYYCSDNEILESHVEELVSYGDIQSFGLSESCDIQYLPKESEIKMKSNILDFDSSKFQLKGEHNCINLLPVIGILSEIGFDYNSIIKHANSFKGLPHRLEYVGEFKEIHFYNDSIATIPEASLQAIKSLGKVDTIIIGGFNRGIDYQAYLKRLSTIELKNIILLGELQTPFYDHLKSSFNGQLFKAETMQEVVALCFNHSNAGDVCLLSPAASSYDQYQNFEDRGDQFKNQIKNY